MSDLRYMYLTFRAIKKTEGYNNFHNGIFTCSLSWEKNATVKCWYKRKDVQTTTP